MTLDYFRIYWALIQRDCITIKRRYKGAIVDAGTQLFVHVLVMGSLFPLMGVSPTLIAPLFIGTQALTLLFLGMNFALRTIADIRFSRFIDYRLTLPLPKRWLVASYITYFIVEALIISAPLMIGGIILLGPRFYIIQTKLYFFIPLYFLTLCLYGLLFLGLSLYYPYDWFMDNLWPRRLSLLVTLSPFYYTWYSAYTFSPKIASLMLVNPFTYAIEGLRASLIGGQLFIHPFICISALCVWICIAIFFVAHSLKKRLDPV